MLLVEVPIPQLCWDTAPKSQWLTTATHTFNSCSSSLIISLVSSPSDPSSSPAQAHGSAGFTLSSTNQRHWKETEGEEKGRNWGFSLPFLPQVASSAETVYLELQLHWTGPLWFHPLLRSRPSAPVTLSPSSVSGLGVAVASCCYIFYQLLFGTQQFQGQNWSRQFHILENHVFCWFIISCWFLLPKSKPWNIIY